MPIYEYNCLQCGLKFDCLVRSNAEQVICPKCKAKDLKRLISCFAFNSKDSRGQVTASSASGCSSCTTHNCATCSG